MIQNFSERISKNDDVLTYSIQSTNFRSDIRGLNLSDGVGIYKDNTIGNGHTELNFKTLKSGGGITIADTLDTVTLTSLASPPIPQSIEIPGIYNSVCMSTGLLHDNYQFSNVDNLYIYITSISVMRISDYTGPINYGLDQLITYSGPCINKLFTNLPFVCIKLSDIIITCDNNDKVVMNLTGNIIVSDIDISDNLDLIKVD